MTTPDDASQSAAHLIETHLHQLPLDDGVLRLMNLSAHGRPPHVAARITEARQQIAGAIVRLLGQHGYRITR